MGNQQYHRFDVEFEKVIASAGLDVEDHKCKKSHTSPVVKLRNVLEIQKSIALEEKQANSVYASAPDASAFFTVTAKVAARTHCALQITQFCFSFDVFFWQKVEKGHPADFSGPYLQLLVGLS
ncbi:hypothetical protein [Deinococcus cellulosilyticus]|uniref:Uncharacterized protein n=1 Tax=Deinococcus cellulosilyticus (strain DSM 18568 / NBRC 106333 / KACC 11606 / 5516J-15) TaxID=1223518 RepID=A0A511N375_DEIC1|nr:hypothetical protein [Deinococcus cellulosilyticus]GEM47292.1 hypothetical protein DC3_29270 [Deinococcus cellulosilyticus NBRC 106333 = KACC 11606]